MIKTIKKLQQFGVMGINQRNAGYILAYNKRSLFPLVDDKFQTKIIAKKAGVPTPELYALIEIQHQIREFFEFIKGYKNFVIKPARGSGGEGILVISGKVKNYFRKSSGSLLTEKDLERHISMILGGAYSLGGHPDSAIVEYEVQFDPIFKKISYLGVPDIRIIIFKGVPVMSMVRLPTKMSDGKANLHQGAVGAGVDIKTGKTIGGVWKNQRIDEHPDTGESIIDLQIPNWDNLLLLASKAYEMTDLGYIGVDLVLDRDLGPLLLELNARPGLNIQIANNQGLIHKLEKIEKNLPKGLTPEERIEFAKAL